MRLSDYKYHMEEELREVLDYYSDLYYNLGQSPVTDEEFDTLVSYYEEKFSTTYNTETPANTGKRLADLSHDFPNLVGTMAKATTVEEVRTWLRHRVDDLGEDLTSHTLAITEKYDGNSATLTYDGDTGEFIQAATRGKDGQGVDLSAYFSHTKLSNDALLTEGSGGKIGVKCEVIITYDDFETLSVELDKTYSSPRNQAAGILNSNEGHLYKEYLTLVPLDVEMTKGYIPREQLLTEILSQDSIINNIQVLPLQNPIIYKDLSREELLEQLTTYQETYLETRFELPYMVDGLVLEFLDKEARDTLGKTKARHNYYLGIKFPAGEQRTTITGLHWDVGKTGRYTPVAEFKPVVFNGAVCKQVSLHNIRHFRDLDLHYEEPVLIEYRGDVLSYLVPDPTLDRDALDPLNRLPMKTTCDYCSEDLALTENETFLYCPNPTCSVNIGGQIVNFFSKLNIKGIKDKTVELLLEYIDLTSLTDLYLMEEQGLLHEVEIPGLGPSKISLLEESIRTALVDKYDYELLGSLNIEGIARSTTEIISQAYRLGDFFTLTEAGDLVVKEETWFLDHLSPLEGISDITARKFKQGLENNLEFLSFIYQANGEDPRVNILALQDREIPMDNLDLTVVFTGFRDKDLQATAEDKGVEFKSSVSRKVDYVVAKDPSSSSGKLTKARDLELPIITIDDFIEILR